MSSPSEMLSRFARHAAVFSPYYAGIEALTVLDRPVSLRLRKPFSHRLLRRKEAYIMRWIRRRFAAQIERYRTYPAARHASRPDAPIWICWLQGEHQAPSFVSSMIARIRTNANGHPVRIVTADGIAEHLTLPGHVIDAYRAGRMPQQQLADIVRAGLLATHGGLWVDASMLVTRPIPQDVFDLPIYNVKGILPNRYRDAVACDSTGWEAYFIASQPGSVTYSFIYDCLVDYWRTYDTLIDYFLLSYLAKAARELLPGGMEEYGRIPGNNRLCEQLSDYLMDPLPFDEHARSRFFDSDTFLYKLTWKAPYPRRTADGSPTMAGWLLDGDPPS